MNDHFDDNDEIRLLEEQLRAERLLLLLVKYSREPQPSLWQRFRAWLGRKLTARA